jgi:adenine C2-methylase RlmN of 23S rRNA A2503 and tRNA A37
LRKKINMFLLNTIICENEYSGSDWSFETTKKYVFEIDSLHIEAGFFVHYKDKTKNKIKKYVIELPSGFGCAMKCKFCASSMLQSCCDVISDNQLFKLFEYIYYDNKLNDIEIPSHKLLVTFTGIGDYYFSSKSIMGFVTLAKAYNFSITLSSCYWTKPLVSKTIEIDKYKHVKIRCLQMTYISHDKTLVERLIPYYRNLEYDIESLVDFIQKVEFRKFRINYLIVKGINDDKDSINKFIDIFSKVKHKIKVRIAKLNKTPATVYNELTPVSIVQMENINEKLIAEGFDSYCFYSHKNDNMNCGQLLYCIPFQTLNKPANALFTNIP